MLATYRQDPRKNVDVAGKGYKPAAPEAVSHQLSAFSKHPPNGAVFSASTEN
jgi:hypothetical protein